MKILGKNSLSAGVKVGLKVVLAIVIICLNCFFNYYQGQYYRRTKKHNIIFIHGNCNTSSNSGL